MWFSFPLNSHLNISKSSSAMLYPNFTFATALHLYGAVKRHYLIRGTEFAITPVPGSIQPIRAEFRVLQTFYPILSHVYIKNWIIDMIITPKTLPKRSVKCSHCKQAILSRTRRGNSQSYRETQQKLQCGESSLLICVTCVFSLSLYSFHFPCVQPSLVLYWSLVKSYTEK